MKNRRQKQITHKKTHITIEEMQQAEMSTNSGKNPSNHTKISTNCTIHSTVGGYPTKEKRQKSKKNIKGISKQNSSQHQIGQQSSKSGRKVKKYEIPLNNEVNSFEVGEPSCREYCVVQQNFIPITDFKQHKLLEDMLAKTAASSCDHNIFAQRHKQPKPKLRKKSMSSQFGNQSQRKIERDDKAVSNIQKPIDCINTEVQAKVQSSEIGMQYSERKEFIEEKQDDKEEKEEVSNKQECSNVNNKDSLTDLLFKLEFTHLGDKDSFTHLSSNQKQHFSQLLQTVLSKLKPSQKPSSSSKIKPISFDNYITQQISSPRQQKSPKSQINNQKLQALLMLREYTQLNCIQDSYNYSQNNQVNTSLISILNFLGYLFCHIQVHYSEEFVYMIRKMYGLPYREKYKRITRNLVINQHQKYNVVQSTVFQDIVNDNAGTQYNYHQIMHFKAVFDAFNQHLEEYRPYYLGNGEQFPWAFKMFITMSQYSIDQDSLQIIFRQAKDKIIQWASQLCGIHINFEEKMEQNNPHELKKLQKQNKLINNWISQENFLKDGIELYSTQTLHQAAEKIYEEMVQEFIRQANFVFN